jgi:hypothetical protein
LQQDDGLAFDALSREIEFTIEAGDITTFPADVVAVKYAQGFHGADLAVANALSLRGTPTDDLRPWVGNHRFADSKGSIAARRALFIGVPDLIALGYQEIRVFAKTIIAVIGREMPDARTLAMTIHGPGFGLDEIESFLNQFTGCIEGLSENRSQGLRRISIVEINPTRVSRLAMALKRSLADSDISTAIATQKGADWSFLLGQPGHLRREVSGSGRALEMPGARSGDKPLVFVAMPFAENMTDVYEFGIYEPAKECDFLCERADQAAFTGEIMEWVKSRIESAAIVIAELTGANPNVFLEVGYAWGKGRPTVLLVREEEELRFDVRGHRCLKYRTIKQLSEILAKELRSLKGNLPDLMPPSTEAMPPSTEA